MNDEQAYEFVVIELREHGPRPGLWAKAFAEANGNESIAKAAYMRFRAAQLMEERHRIDEQVKREAKEREKSERAKQSEEFDERAYYTEYSWIGWGLLVLMFVVILFSSVA